MSRLFNLMKQDLLLSWRNGLVISTAVLLGIMAAAIQFLPQNLEADIDEYIYDASENKDYETFLRQGGATDDAFMDSQESLEGALAESSRGVGIIYDGTVAEPNITLLTVGNLADENINVVKATVDLSASTMQGEPLPDNYQVQLLRAPSEPIPLNLKFVPIAIVFEVVLMGYMFGAVMIFEEKQEGINRALRISPMTTMDYIWSKNIMFMLMGLLYGGLLLLIAFGLDVDYGRNLLLILLATSMMTFVGLAIAVFFNNISEWFFIGVGVLIINILPTISYSLPTFMPSWVTWIPSFPVLFGLRELLFPTGQEGFFMPLLIQLLVYNVIAFTICYWAVERKLMKAA